MSAPAKYFVMLSETRLSGGLHYKNMYEEAKISLDASNRLMKVQIINNQLTEPLQNLNRELCD